MTNIVRHQIGATSVTRIEEQAGLSLPPAVMFADWDPDVLNRHADWMIPACYSVADERLVSSVHSWVIKTPRHVIVVDTCAGNQKQRPNLPRFHLRDMPYLANLAAAGVRPEQVDYVLLTHLHGDHCGCNTTLRDGHWMATFPNAKYIFTRREYDHWMQPGAREGFNLNVFEDSVQPIIDAGLAHIVDDQFDLDGVVSMRLTPGHTSGHAAFILRSDGQHGLFSGDIMHQPIQVYHPEWNSCFCEQQEQARISRQWVLDYCVEHDAMLFPTHFAGSSCGRVRRHGERFSWSFA